MKVIALIDGEHYPAITRWALASARASGYQVVTALLVGGVEKLDADRSLDLGDTPVLRVDAGAGPMDALAGTIDRLMPEGVLDLSDEPVLGYRSRMEMVAVALSKGVPYLGPDFRFDPPVVEAPLAVPTVAVIGTGKRVAKTAIGGHLARLTNAAGMTPVVVAMGRGGPAGPVAAGPGDVTVDALLARVERGEHAASDFLEDALTAGVPTIGARRAGGGLAGGPFVTNVAAAAQAAVDLGAGLVILEGSGAAVPTVPWDAGVLVVPASLDPEYLSGYLGPLRVLLSDLAVFIMDAGPMTGPDNLSTLGSRVRRLRTDIRVATVELQPVPLADVRDKHALFLTTAHHDTARRLAEHLERTAGCRVVMVSSNLADRAALERDLARAPRYDVVLTELKAAAVDVAARRARERGADVVFVDNRPATVAGESDGSIDDLLLEVAGLAHRRAQVHG